MQCSGEKKLFCLNDGERDVYSIGGEVCIAWLCYFFFQPGGLLYHQYSTVGQLERSRLCSRNWAAKAYRHTLTNNKYFKKLWKYEISLWWLPSRVHDGITNSAS